LMPKLEMKMILIAIINKIIKIMAPSAGFEHASQP